MYFLTVLEDEKSNIKIFLFLACLFVMLSHRGERGMGGAQERDVFLFSYKAQSYQIKMTFLWPCLTFITS